MRALRIVFMGTPDFAVGILKALLDNDYPVVGVVTSPDKPSGRGLKTLPSAVKRFAVEKELKVLQPVNLKADSFVNELRELRANLYVVVAFRMLPRVVWEIPEYGTFNLHASLLPEYRGAAPINWAIMNGEERTGVSTFFIDEKIDTGRIILQKEVAIDPEDTAGTLHDKLMVAGAGLVVETVNRIAANTVRTQEQPEGLLKPAPKLFRDNCRINWNAPGETIYNTIRGLSPYPAAWTLLANGGETVEVKIYKCRYEKTGHSYPTGKLLIGKRELKVAVENGYIIIDELQLPGKRKMNTADLLNGYTFDRDARVL
ncbi:MAG: methionyl-tRNA formyltransferase [Flavobacteriaceae bacterium]|nr:methionyl-tRNA formyltransferase [Flavobacteriaceae bacterium]